MTLPVIALPGGVMPAALRYAALASALGDEVQFEFKDLEVYAGEEPPAGYSIDLEVEAVARSPIRSASSAFTSRLFRRRIRVLGFAGTHPDHLLSLALFEPAYVPGELSPDEARYDARLRNAITGRDGAEFMQAFVSVQLRPGVDAPPLSGPPQPWMRYLPAGIRAMTTAFRNISSIAIGSPSGISRCSSATAT